MHFDKGRRDFGRKPAEDFLADPANRFNSWSVSAHIAGAGLSPTGAGDTLAAAIQSALPTPFDATTHIYGTTGNDILTGTALDDVIDDI